MLIEELKSKGLAIRTAFLEGSQRYFVVDLSKVHRPIVEWGPTEAEAWKRTLRHYTTQPHQFSSDDVKEIWKRWLPMIVPPDEEWLERSARNADSIIITEACRATLRKHKNDPFSSAQHAHRYMYACCRTAKEERAARSPHPAKQQEDIHV